MGSARGVARAVDAGVGAGSLRRASAPWVGGGFRCRGVGAWVGGGCWRRVCAGGRRRWGLGGGCRRRGSARCVGTWSAQGGWGVGGGGWRQVCAVVGAGVRRRRSAQGGQCEESDLQDIHKASPGRRYMLRLVLSASQTATWSSGADFYHFDTTPFLVDQPPLGGRCRVSPETGNASTTLFALWSSNWQDDDLPLVHRFGWTAGSIGDASTGTGWTIVRSWGQQDRFDNQVWLWFRWGA